MVKQGDKVVLLEDVSMWYKGMTPGSIYTVLDVRLIGTRLQIRIAEWEEKHRRIDFWSMEIGGKVYFVPFPE